jgi:hypothetical protein
LTTVKNYDQKMRCLTCANARVISASERTFTEKEPRLRFYCAAMHMRKIEERIADCEMYIRLS